MSTPHPQTRDPKKWVQSPKKVWYWRHPTGSFWKGPPDDRIWVASIDSPPDLEPPPDDEMESVGAGTAPASPSNPVARQFGSIPNMMAGGDAHAPQYHTLRPPPDFAQTRIDPFGDRLGATPSASLPPPYVHSPYGPYTGPWSNTMRHRDNSARSEMERANERGAGDSPRRPTTPPGRRGSAGPFSGHTRADHGRPRTDIRDEYANSLSDQSRRKRQNAQVQEHRERAREQSLRDRALGSRSGPVATAVPRLDAQSRPIPEAYKAARGPNGHPIFPQTHPQEDESDYGGSDTSDDNDDALEKWRSRERDHVSKARQKSAPNTRPSPSTAPRPSSDAGMWRDLSIATIDEARNLLLWMGAGCPQARSMFRNLVEYFGHHPTALRPDGILHLLRKQNSAESTWLYVTTGDSTPMSWRDGSQRPAISRNERRKRAKQMRMPAPLPSISGTSTVATLESGGDQDDPMPPTDPAAEAPFEQSYAGHSPTAEGIAPTTGHRGPTAALAKVYAEMLSRQPSKWQLADRHQPYWITPADQRLAFGEALAFPEPATRRDLTALSAIHGDGAHRLLRVRVAFSWLHQHGVPADSPVSLMVHSYAASWRNHRERNPSPNGQSFQKEPRNSFDVLNWPDSRITEWHTLMHGPVRPGVVTTYPRNPSRGLLLAAPAAPDSEMPAAGVNETPEPGEIPDARAGEMIIDTAPTIQGNIPTTEMHVDATQIALPDSPTSDEGDDNHNPDVTSGGDSSAPHLTEN
ncbi:hypothetical protein B0H13DRAFT_1921104 [Mycena leptocephala]|nr:hypothetical protein B0H13DRAFT_1921104 [Mycena leptocephala]